MAGLGRAAALHYRPHEMTTLPSEINAAAVKNSPAEKVTPMMQQYMGGLK
jgi:DNA mismatch repair protein MutS